MLLIVLPCLLYVLGFLAERRLTAPDDGEWAPLVLFRRFAVGLLLAGWLGIALAELGRFSALALVVVLALLCAALAARRPGGAARSAGWGGLWQPGRWGDRRELAALATLLALTLALFGHPGEDVLGGRDPGIYFATGLGIAAQGSVLQDDWALRALAADLGDTSINWWLFQSVHGWPLRFPGQLFVRDLAEGVVEPGFMPWYPVAIAFAADTAGARAGLWVNPALATLGVLAVYFVGRALFGSPVAWAGAALLALDLAEVWFARYTMAEPVTQFLVWLGLYALVALRRRPSLSLGLLAGLAWSGTLLARVDSVLLVPAVAAYLAWRAREPAERRPALVALGVLGLGGAHFALHVWRFAPGYATMTFSGATLAVAAGGIAAALATAALAWLLLPAPSPAAARGARVRLVALLALLALVGLFTYTVRPLAASPAGGESAALDVAARESLVRLGWYVTPLGLLLAAVAVARLLWTGRWRRAAPLVGLLALSLAFYLPNPLVSSDQPWAARRYLPVVLPGLLLLAAYGAVAAGAWLARRLGARRQVGAAVAGGLCLVVAAGEWRATTAIAAYREHAGAVAQVEALAALFPPEAIVLFPRSVAGTRLTLPLQYLGGRAAFVLPADGPVEGVLGVVRRWREEGRPVYWVVPLGTRFPTPPGVRFAPAGQFSFDAPQLERPLDRLPSTAQQLRFELQLYRVELPPPAGSP
ncbi:MAG TPA: glycosyltransferase family 39 protein [Chloroflexota bacterium]|nr:glycosyltransferase family 39 protein [Chloroflexota bacterium]